MAIVSSKRQITLPIDLCREAHIEPGDEVETFVCNEQITVVRKEHGAAKGILRHIQINRNLSDEQSLQSAVDGRLEEKSA